MYLHSKLEPSTVCSPPVTDTEVTHNWKMPDERKKKQKKRSIQQFKTFFWYGTCLSFFYDMHREPDLSLKEHAA